MRGGVFGTTPLHLTADRGHTEVVELLISKGADVNAKMKDGWTPLHSAARYGRKGHRHWEITELLIANGADVNAITNQGEHFHVKYPWTPLHIAAINGHKEIAELLIAAGADVNAEDGDGYTPLDCAIKDKHTETADLLRKHGGKTGEELKAEGK